MVCRPAKCDRTSATAAAVLNTMHLYMHSRQMHFAMRFKSGVFSTRTLTEPRGNKFAARDRKSAVPGTWVKRRNVTLQNKRTVSSVRGNGDRRQRDCGLRGSQNDAQRYARTQRHDVGHFSPRPRSREFWLVPARSGPMRKKFVLLRVRQSRENTRPERARELSFTRARYTASIMRNGIAAKMQREVRLFKVESYNEPSKQKIIYSTLLQWYIL